jgi:hypothetical protein
VRSCVLSLTCSFEFMRLRPVLTVLLNAIKLDLLFMVFNITHARNYDETFTDVAHITTILALLIVTYV